MKYALMGLTGLMALGPVVLAPQTASAHHGGWGWGRGPGFGIYVGPATAIGATGMGTAIVPIITTATPMGMAPAGSIATAITTSLTRSLLLAPGRSGESAYARHSPRRA
jgi:hypothetical protein